MDHMTAKMSCFLRAYHYKEKNSPVFADAAAKKLLGEDYEKIADSLKTGTGFFLPGFNSSPEEGLRRLIDEVLAPPVLGRSAFAERALENELRLGCRQYLVFGAGYDTFALRENIPGLTVFELDRPELLRDKSARAERAGLRSRAVPVPCALEREDWQAELLRARFAPSKKTFASLLGLTYY